MEKQACISTKKAAFGYKKAAVVSTVLKQVNLDFYPHDMVGIVGLNGTGKSTLLKSMCGLLPLLQGEVLIDNRAIGDMDLPELAKKIAVVLTEKIAGFNLTAYDVVASGQMPYTGAFHRLYAANKIIIDQAIASCGIKAHQHKLLNELSDGLFQKTVIAKALAQQTQVMLLDEPTAFLDYASKHELFLLLKALSEKDGKCILVSSHDLDLLLKYCNKLVVISGQDAVIIPVSEARQNAAFMQIGGGFI